MFTFRPIGVVRSPFTDTSAIPKGPDAKHDAGGVLEIDPALEAGLADIEGFSHLYVLWVFDRAEPGDLIAHPPADDRPHGVFATRSPRRPNPIALTVVRLVRRDGSKLHVRGVDMLDGTPIVDLKPYLSNVPASELKRGWLAEAESRRAGQPGVAPPRSFAGLTLETERLTLRPFVESDAEALFEIFRDAEVTRYWSTPPWESLEPAHRQIARDRSAMAAGEFLRLGLVRRSDARLVGMCTLFAFHDQCRRAELGYGLAREAWGGGVMSEALTALLDHAFGALGLHRVEADTDTRNAASCRMLERLGFVREGTLRERWIVAGEISDTAFYGVLASDWKARR